MSASSSPLCIFLQQGAPCLDVTLREHLGEARKEALVLQQMTATLCTEFPAMSAEETALTRALGLSAEKIVSDLAAAMMRAQVLGDLVREVRKNPTGFEAAARKAVQWDARPPAAAAAAARAVQARAQPPPVRPEPPKQPRMSAEDWGMFLKKR